MADLIDRDELMKDLRSECPESDVCLSDSPCIECIVNSQPAVNRWIPCSERLPEIDIDVIVFYPYWNDKPIQVAHLAYDELTFELSDGEFNLPTRTVTHWMPLPVPPDGGAKDG